MMKKVLLTTISCAFAVSITVGFAEFNKGDTGGSPTRPDLAYTHVGSSGGTISNGTHGDSPSPQA
ncbi:hypothetical protein [Bacillus sp. 123MFChir2]|uniref:hypothetical protein n=1 Tax=Bacillus sp. 123MFChir2 TaxID=1169144 RepID=UPI00035D3812|nr:hypothetical protein [Bacillus sp. 123MFChir2]